MELIPINLIKPCISSEIHEFDEKLFHKLKISVKTFGQIKNLVVIKESEESYICLEGRKILRAMQENNEGSNELIESAWVKVIPGQFSEIQALFSILLNENLFLVDYIKIAEKLRSLQEIWSVEQLSSVIPFDRRKIRDLIKMLDFDWKEFAAKGTDLNQQSLFEN